MGEQVITLEKRGHVLLIGFNRPEKYNGFKHPPPGMPDPYRR